MAAKGRLHPLALALAAMVLSGCLIGERPVLTDSDADELPDDLERDGWTVTVRYEVRPCNDDSFVPLIESYHVVSNVFIDDNDTDGLIDSKEFAYGTDPNLADTDGDGLTDGEEWDLQRSATFFQPSKLRGTKADSDDDCLGDRDEAVTGFPVEALDRVVLSDPTNADGDRDGLPDWHEIFVVGTDPLDPDTDDDGSSDRFDVDPRHDVAIQLAITHVRVDRSQTASASFEGSIITAGSHGFSASAPVATANGTWSAVEGPRVPGTVDVNDTAAREFIAITITWFGQTQSGDLHALSLGPRVEGRPVEIRIDPVMATASVVTDDGPLPVDVCVVDGSDGSFGFDLRLGTPTTPAGQWSSLCAPFTPAD